MRPVTIRASWIHNSELSNIGGMTEDLSTDAFSRPMLVNFKKNVRLLLISFLSWL